MNFDKLTNRSKSLVQDAVSLASSRKHQYISPEHILKVMLNDNDATIMDLITQSGGRIADLNRYTDESLNKIPEVMGNTVQSLMSQDFTRIMNDAEQLADKNGDKFITTERILQALASATGVSVADVLRNSGVNAQQLNQAIN